MNNSSTNVAILDVAHPIPRGIRMTDNSPISTDDL